MAIRSGLMKAIYEALASHRFFDVHDFRVTEQEYQDGGSGLLVNYRHDTSCFFYLESRDKGVASGALSLTRYTSIAAK